MKTELNEKLNEATKAARAEYYARVAEGTVNRVAALEKELAAAGWDFQIGFAYPRSNVGKIAYRIAVARREWARQFVMSESACRSMGAPDPVKMKPNVAEIVAKLAEQTAKADFDAYLCKLAKKIGKEVADASLTGSLWNWSTLTVICTDGEVQTWATQCIINYSVLHKPFNQWPTRRRS
jgi:hypothetical protein